MLPKINPTQTKAWKQLEAHRASGAYKHAIVDKKNFKFDLDGILTYDFSLQNWNEQTLEYMLNLAESCGLKQAIESMYTGKKINETENRAVLHTALRDFSKKPIYVDSLDVSLAIAKEREKIKLFCDSFYSGKIKGSTGKEIQHIVNIGIGGSSIGPDFVIDALKDYRKTELSFHFLDSIDGAGLKELLDKIDLESSLFVVVSKTFTTLETMTNANLIKDLLIEQLGPKSLKQHLIAVTTNALKAEEFGVEPDNIFLFWDWVCGRFSLASSVGLVVALSIGYEQFEAFLKGAELADKHFRNTAFEQNIPVLNALLGIWNVNFLGAQTQAIIPYSKMLGKLPSYLQQAAMESNGKSVDRNGEYVNYATCPIIWGELGNEAQHSFFQLLHQGTHHIPADFILVERATHDFNKHEDLLKANFYAQIKALSEGRSLSETKQTLESCNIFLAENQILHRVFKGDKPVTQIYVSSLSPESLGALIAIYEHTYFTQGIIWNLYSFDQWGVELGKTLLNE